ncbi:MAG: hypothetical protein ACFHX7_07345 [Pseudomonadota bacterium]
MQLKRLYFPLALVSAIACWLVVTTDLLPDQDNLLAADYGYFLPHLLNGYYWFLGNGLTVPWFTPAQCAGIPQFANPQSLYYSVPQFLTLLFDPLAAVQMTFFLFAIIGFCGAWLLAGQLGMTHLVRCFAGFAFMLNGLYLSRMLTGHLSFHTFMLLPVLLYLLLAGRGRWLFTLLAGLVFAYFIHAGATVVIVPYLVAIAVMLLFTDADRHAWLRTGLAGLLGLALSLGKLVAALYFNAQFPRDFYLLPGAEGPLASIYLAARGLFLPLPDSAASSLIANTSFTISGTELNYGVGLVPLVIIVTGLVIRRPGFTRVRLQPRHLALLVLLLLPVVVNTWWPPLTDLLKRLPYFQTTTSLFRWYLVYILPVIVIAAMYLQRLPSPWHKPLTILAIAGLMAGSLISPPPGETARPYRPFIIVSAYYAAKSAQEAPPVTRVMDSLQDGKRLWLPGAGDALAGGGSQLACNEPLFGYRLEQFRFNNVFPGSIYATPEGDFNFYRPECFIFPGANRCEAADRFSASDRARLEAFAGYRPIAFARPMPQRVADLVSLGALLLLLPGLVITLYREIKKGQHL